MTAIEIIVVLTIIAIIAAIAIPDFLKFQRRQKSSEVKTNLGAIYVTQMAYFADHKTYAGGKNCFDLLGWSPSGLTQYAYYCGDDVIAPTWGAPPELAVPCTITGAATSSTGFTICASGNIDRDKTQDEWIINDAKVFTNTVNDVGT